MKRLLAVLVACQSPSTPPATRDCAAIADALASVEVGNYAPPVRRARSVARLAAACEAADPSADEARCLAAATTRDAVAKCGTAIPLDVDCEDVIAKVRAAKPAQLDPDLERQLQQGYAVMARACDEDGWPLELKRCVVESSRLEACTDKLSKELRDRLSQRIVESLRPR